MYSTTAYIYQQITRVLSVDNSGAYFNLRYDQVYAQNLTISKGVDNVLLFEFINQDQKPVNISGSTLTFRVISNNGNEVLIQKNMVALSATLGRAKVTLTPEDLDSVIAQPASYSIARASGNLTEAVFTNAQSGARAPVNIVDSVLPEFVMSAPLTIPTIEITSQASYGGSSYNGYPGYWGGNPNGSGYYNSWANTEYYSSFIEPQNAVTTVQMDLVGYTGTIKAQGAENYQSIWYNVTESETYLNHTGTIHMNIIGWHPLLRLAFNNSVFATTNPPGIPAIAYAVCEDGVLTSVVVTNSGSGYLAPPLISIIGNGSGATAEAVIELSSGLITAINVTNGGSGYWPVPAGGVNVNAYPVPPANQGALVAINTGFAVNLLVR